jgi:hypothetical protein
MHVARIHTTLAQQLATLSDTGSHVQQTRFPLGRGPTIVANYVSPEHRQTHSEDAGGTGSCGGLVRDGV